jgi:hypothetical protein
MRGRIMAGVAVVAALGAGASAGPAAASSGSARIAASRVAAAGPASGRVNLDVRVKRFVVRGRQVHATGVVDATLQGAGATPTTVRQRVELQVRPGRSCQILVLTLDQLNLVLLGVTVHLDRVELTVTGEQQVAYSGGCSAASRAPGSDLRARPAASSDACCAACRRALSPSPRPGRREAVPRTRGG